MLRWFFLLAPSSFILMAGWIATSDDPRVVTIPADRRYTFRAVFLSKSKILAIGGGPETAPIRLWDVATAAEVRTFQGDAARIFDIALSKNEELFAATGNDRVVRIWKGDGSLLGSIPQDGVVSSVCFHPDGSLVSAYRDKPRICIWDTKRRTLSREIKYESKFGMALVTCSPDGKTLVASGDDGKVRIWDFVTGKEIRALKGIGRGVAYSPDGAYLAVNSPDGIVTVYNASTFDPVAKIPINSYGAVIFSPDSRLLYADDREAHVIRAFDMPSGKMAAEYHSPLGGWAFGLAISSDGRSLAVFGEGSKAGSIFVLELTPAAGGAGK